MMPSFNKKGGGLHSMKQEKLTRSLAEHTRVLEALLQNHEQALVDLSTRVVECFHRGNRLLVLGSGAFGPIANRIASLFTHRLGLDRPLLPAVSLSQDPTLALSLGRDNQLSEFFTRQVRSMSADGDVLLAFGDNRRDQALEDALDLARQQGCATSAMVQSKETLTCEPPDFLFQLETDSPARAVESALFFGHLLCELVEAELFGI